MWTGNILNQQYTFAGKTLSSFVDLGSAWYDIDWLEDEAS